MKKYIINESELIQFLGKTKAPLVAEKLKPIEPPLTFDQVEDIYHATESRLGFARSIEAHITGDKE